jgi:hypothetical protein
MKEGGTDRSGPEEETGYAVGSYLTGEEKLASPRSTSAQAQYT